MNRPAHAAPRTPRVRPAAGAARAAAVLLAAGAVTAAGGTSAAVLHHAPTAPHPTSTVRVTTGHLTSQPTKTTTKPQPQPKPQTKPAPEPQPAPATTGRWSGRQLTITVDSLGAVKLGMTLAQAERAAGYTFDGMGDGFAYPTNLPTGYPHDFVGLEGTDAHPVVVCVGAEASSSNQVVVTPEGFRLGQSVDQLKAVYGSKANFVPPPANPGMTDNEGFVVNEHGGTLVFVVDLAGEYVVGIMGGPTGIGPNSCTG